MNDPVTTPPTEPAPKLMKFVLAVEQQPTHLPALLQAVQEFAAPSFFVTADRGFFWDWQRSGQARVLGNMRPVYAAKDTSVPDALAATLIPWSGEHAPDIWVVYLPSSASARPRRTIQQFLQFVSIQPASIEFVRSIRKPSAYDTRTFLSFSGDVPQMAAAPEVPPDVYEVTDLFFAWRLRASHGGTLAAQIPVTAFWAHVEQAAV